MARFSTFQKRARDSLIGRKLASQKSLQKSKGKPLKIPQFNFRMSLKKKVQSLYGQPHFVSRALQVEKKTQKLMKDLSKKYTSVLGKLSRTPDLFAKEWKELIVSLDFTELNDLIDKHNKYYPIEANLQIDPDSGAPLLGSVPWVPKERISIEGILKRFPADMNASPGSHKNH